VAVVVGVYDTAKDVVDKKRRRIGLGNSQRHPMRETGLLVGEVAHGPLGFEFSTAHTVEMDEQLNALRLARSLPSALGHRILRS
jgi:hypothetical protein